MLSLKSNELEQTQLSIFVRVDELGALKHMVQGIFNCNEFVNTPPQQEVNYLHAASTTLSHSLSLSLSLYIYISLLLSLPLTNLSFSRVNLASQGN